jgi:hypothetical protein
MLSNCNLCIDTLKAVNLGVNVLRLRFEIRGWEGFLLLHLLSNLLPHKVHHVALPGTFMSRRNCVVLLKAYQGSSFARVNVILSFKHCQGPSRHDAH